jgi:hypothetical protein
MHSKLCSHVGIGAETHMFCHVCKVERGSSSTVEDDIKRIDQFMKVGSAQSCVYLACSDALESSSVALLAARQRLSSSFVRSSSAP